MSGFQLWRPMVHNSGVLILNKSRSVRMHRVSVASHNDNHSTVMSLKI